MSEHTEQKLGPKQAKWVAELRSGKYPQTLGYLHRVREKGEMKVGYCCLGVACVVAGVPLEQHEDDGAVAFFEGNAQHLPVRVMRDLAFRDRSGTIDKAFLTGAWREVADLAFSLTSLNDCGWSFERIADFVEANPAAVFTAEV